MTYKVLWDFENAGGQDGTICNDYLFRFDPHGFCKVYSMKEQKKIASFTLDQIDVLMPHSNAVCFGTEYYEDKDPFPLLYTNIYNNYGHAEDRLEGVCCVYRIFQNGDSFDSKLVQVIRIGFTENLDCWKSMDNNGDVRPYGNFLVDTDHNRLLAFTMRDAAKTTRYFTFALPKASDGIYSELYHANVVTLTIEDVREQFDCDYSYFIQGACYHDNKIYSVEGFTVNDPSHKKNPPRLQVIDLTGKTQCADIDLYGLGLHIEPEFIAFYQGTFYYGDGTNHLYQFNFD